MVTPEPPQNLIGDNAYDSDKLETRLRSYGIELISPHRSNRKNGRQDLRMYDACDGIADVGELKDCLPGYRIFVGLLCVTNDTLIIFSGCSISDAA
jgi:hypothetical protein